MLNSNDMLRLLLSAFFIVFTVVMFMRIHNLLWAIHSSLHCDRNFLQATKPSAPNWMLIRHFCVGWLAKYWSSGHRTCRTCSYGPVKRICFWCIHHLSFCTFLSSYKIQLSDSSVSPTSWVYSVFSNQPWNESNSSCPKFSSQFVKGCIYKSTIFKVMTRSYCVL